MDADHGAVGEAFGDGVESVAIVGVVEGRDEDQAVGYVEVGVGGGEALALEEDGCGHGERKYLKGLAVQVAGFVEPLEVLGERKVVLVGSVGLDGGEDRVGADEAGYIVDVAVGVVPGAAAVEPDRLLDAEEVVKGLFQQGAGGLPIAQSRVALLDIGEEALLGGEEDASAVGIDGAAFEDQPMAGSVGEREDGPEAFDGVEVGDVGGDEVVIEVVRILCPCIELPVGEGYPAAGLAEEDGAGVTEPDAVGAPVVEVEPGEVCALLSEHPGRTALGGEVVDQDVDVFGAGEVTDDLAVYPGDGLEFAGPVLRVVRPCDPGGGVGGPLGRHAIALLTGTETCGLRRCDRGTSPRT